LPLGDALYYIYSSKLYKSLLDKSTKLWYSSTLSLYETLEKKKTEKKRRYNGDTKILLFKMFCIDDAYEWNRSMKELEEKAMPDCHCKGIIIYKETDGDGHVYLRPFLQFLLFSFPFGQPGNIE